jgi:hypothetical protein
MTSRRLLTWLLAAILAIVIFVAAPLFSPQRGLERAWRQTLADVEDGDWTAFEARLDPSYRDNFGADRTESLRKFKFARKQFLALTINREGIETSLSADKKQATFS